MQHDPAAQSAPELHRGTQVPVAAMHPAPTGIPPPVWQHEALPPGQLAPSGTQDGGDGSHAAPSAAATAPASGPVAGPAEEGEQAERSVAAVATVVTARA
jgi:hypothetical protein